MLIQLIYLAFLYEMMYDILDESTEELYGLIFMYYFMGGK